MIEVSISSTIFLVRVVLEIGLVVLWLAFELHNSHVCEKRINEFVIRSRVHCVEVNAFVHSRTKYILKAVFYFPSAQTRRSERPYLVELMANIIVFTTNCSVKDKLIEEIKFRKTMVHLFNDSLLEIVDTGNSNNRICYLSISCFYQTHNLNARELVP